MFCWKCGAQVEEGAKFCKKCGAKMEEAKIDGYSTAGETNPSVTLKSDQINHSARYSRGKTPFETKKIIMIFIIVVAAILVVSAGIFTFFKLRKTKIDLNEYLEFTSEGYDGHGTVQATFNTDKFVKENKGKIKAKKNIRTLLKEDRDIKQITDKEEFRYSNDRDIALLFARIYGERGGLQGNTEDVSNGDTVKYDWHIETTDKTEDEMIELAKKAFNVILVADEAEYIVEGLEEIAKFDAFEEVVIGYTGIAPEARAELKEVPYDNGLSYRLENGERVKNGDTVTVVADYYGNEENYVNEYNRLPDSLTKDYVVEGIDEYVMQASEISEEDLEPMIKDCQDVMEKKAADMKDDYSSLDGMDFVSAYLLTKKSENAYGNYNYVVIICKDVFKFKSDKAETETVDNYFVASYPKVIKTSDGSIHVDFSGREIPYQTHSFRYEHKSGFWGGSRIYYIAGFNSFDAAFSEAVTKKIDNYSYEVISEGDGSEATEVDSSQSEDDDMDEDSSMEDKSQYILPESSSRRLTREDIEGLSAEECRLARNEIYARHGRIFDDAELKKYFEGKDWYEGTVDASDFRENELSDVEIANRDLIVQYERDKGYR